MTAIPDFTKLAFATGARPATGSLPTTVLYDSAGREVWRFTGERNWADAESARLLAEAAGA